MENWVLICFLFSCGSLFSARAFCPERCDCQHAQHFLCTNRGMRAVPKSPLRNSEDVRVFSLGGNFINNISVFDFNRYSSLMRLNLQYNRIQNIHPKAFEKLFKLEELYLGNNLISAIPPGTLQSLKKLTTLYANNNAIKKITPDSFANLESVVKLRLDGNSVEMLQDSVFKSLTNLIYLHLESNRLQQIHRNAFAQLRKLQFLNLSHNKQTALRNVFLLSQLRSLATLLISENHIQHVGNHVFQNLQKLSKLSLSNNNISRIDREALKGLSSLKELLIDGNKLTTIPAGLLDPLARIEELDFSRNQISNVDPLAFTHLTLLKVLKLKDNHLTSLAGSVFALNSVLYILDLHGNNWTCDCRLRELKRWITSVHAQGKLLTVFVQCHHPGTLKGKYLDYIDTSGLLPQGNQTHLCETPLGPEERRGALIQEKPTEEATREEEEGKKEVGVQGDQGGPGERASPPADQTLRKKSRSRSRPAPKAAGKWEKGRRGSVDTPKAKTPPTLTALVRSSGNHGDRPRTPAIALSPGDERFDPLLQDGEELPLVTDPCHFNHHVLNNVSVDGVTARGATVHWSARPHRVGPDPITFRVLLDRFGPAGRFPCYVHAGASARSLALRELTPDAPYMVCVEGVVGGATCPMALRDHCAGVVTRADAPSPVDLQLVTVATLAANGALLLLAGVVWLGRGLRRQLRRRTSAVQVRRLYSARRPFRAVATDASADFASYQSGRPRLDEGDLIEFPCDRFLDGGGGARRDNDMQRFSD